MQIRLNSGKPERHIIADDSSLQEIPRTHSSHAISNFNGSEQDTDTVGHNTPELNLNVSVLPLL